LTDPRKFKAPYNPKERIWQETDRLRAAHLAGRELPVKVLDLVPVNLGASNWILSRCSWAI
jgi:hypothetical protein